MAHVASGLVSGLLAHAAARAADPHRLAGLRHVVGSAERANAVACLVSDGARYSTGAALDTSGGQIML